MRAVGERVVEGVVAPEGEGRGFVLEAAVGADAEPAALLRRADELDGAHALAEIVGEQARRRVHRETRGPARERVAIGAGGDEADVHLAAGFGAALVDDDILEAVARGRVGDGGGRARGAWT